MTLSRPLYYANPCAPSVIEEMQAGRLGYIDTPRQQNLPLPGVKWCADNGAFSARFEEGRWWSFLLRHRERVTTCSFATAPDVVGNAEATWKRSWPWLERIQSLGYPVAYVAQDGLESLPVPWDHFDVLFVGGTTEWKLSDHVVALAAEARQRGKGLHVGRVNSFKRLLFAARIGADSVDGTFLTFGPDHNLPRLRAWYRKLDEVIANAPPSF